jgi:hypothetical protein
MTWPSLAVLALPAVALLPRAALSAQAPAAASPSAAVAVARLTAGATVRAAAAGVRVTGSVQTAGPDSLVLTLRDGATARLAVAGVDTLWRAGRATGHGAKIGAIAGGIALAGLGVAFAQGLCDNPGGCGDDTRKAALAGGALGVAGGAVLGAGLGSLARTWRRVYP